jgi:hypothetical protein
MKVQTTPISRLESISYHFTGLLSVWSGFIYGVPTDPRAVAPFTVTDPVATDGTVTEILAPPVAEAVSLLFTTVGDRAGGAAVCRDADQSDPRR